MKNVEHHESKEDDNETGSPSYIFSRMPERPPDSCSKNPKQYEDNRESEYERKRVDQDTFTSVRFVPTSPLSFLRWYTCNEDQISRNDR